MILTENVLYPLFKGLLWLTTFCISKNSYIQKTQTMSFTLDLANKLNFSCELTFAALSTCCYEKARLSYFSSRFCYEAIYEFLIVSCLTFYFWYGTNVTFLIRVNFISILIFLPQILIKVTVLPKRLVIERWTLSLVSESHKTFILANPVWKRWHSSRMNASG